MNKRSLFGVIIPSIVAILSLTTALYAQSGNSGPKKPASPSFESITVGKAELKRFATALRDVHLIQVDFQKKFRTAIAKSPLTRREFMTIYQAERSTHRFPSRIGPAKKRQYHALIRRVLKIETGDRNRMIVAVKKDGFKLARFDQIVRAVHSDPKLAGRLKKLRK